MGPKDLEQVLLPLKKYDNPNLIVGLKISDDAAVYRLSPDLAVVQTVDFFPPVVDDPYLYGAIAAANSMSDVYAMGGEVLMGINIVAFPGNLPSSILSLILQGGADKMAEVGAVVAGGHTVIDTEPKYGISVTGKVHPEQVFTKGGAKAGDVLYLTKPLGTGLITTAHKRDVVDLQDLKAATDSMTRLNRNASLLLRELGYSAIHACTDITGFGILGHASEMADHSEGIDLVIRAESLPILPGARRYAQEGCTPGGAGRNRIFLQEEGAEKVKIQPGIEPDLEDLLFDPQTSGGLFFSIPAEKAVVLETLFREAGEPLWKIGEVRAGSALVVVE
ncbi:MAG: selenide, water dikinase [Chloroflexi bacterium]|jgi:selenide,water dikinase|nr:selenide, water dikinase [Chloroflexota bacterium]